MVARRALSVCGRELGSKRLLALAEPLAIVPPDPTEPEPVVLPEAVFEVVPVVVFASIAEALSV
jgi:hypothetical protein